MRWKNLLNIPLLIFSLRKRNHEIMKVVKTATATIHQTVDTGSISTFALQYEHI